MIHMKWKTNLKYALHRAQNSNKNLGKIAILSVFVVILTTKNTVAQVSFSQNFNVAPSGWTGSMYHNPSNSGCGSPNMIANLFLFGPAADLISPLVGTSNGGVITLNYDYKVADYSANNVGTPNPWGSFNVQYSSSLAGPWTTIETINSTNHVVSGNCVTRTVVFNPPSGALYLKWDALWDDGDFYLNIDNVTVNETTGTACSGTPTPGNTLSTSSSTCPNTLFTLSLQNTIPGTGISYVWQSADNLAFTNNLQTLSSTLNFQTITSQTSAKYYRCQVSCGANSAFSTPVLVAQNPGTSCYCVPSYTDGKVSGDLISNIVIPTTSLSNNTGTNPVNPAYTFFTGSSNLTATLQAGSSYNVVVTTGTSSNQNMAAWIDYNNNGFFETSERIGYTINALSAGSTASFPIVLACNPPLGVHRMRVRDVFNVSGITIDPCALYSYGETEDYNITITAAVACPAPSGLTASNPTVNSVQLNWSIGCSETAWKVEYGPAGFTPGSGTHVSTTTTNYTLTGLTCGANYQFYVYANCGVAGNSAPSNLTSITLLSCPCSGAPSPGNTLVNGVVCSSGGSVTLSLQNAQIGAGISYQWQRANNLSFSAGLVNLGTSPTQVAIVNGPSYFRCLVTCSASSITTPSNPVLVGISGVPTIGNSMENPIFIGQAPCATYPYSITLNNGNCYTNNLVGSQPSPDIFFQFTLPNLVNLDASLCGSSFDTYMHLLDNTGAIISTNNNNGPLCTGIQSSISSLLGAGTYYIVIEGAGSLTGNLVFNLSTNAACQAVVNVNAFVQGYYVPNSVPSSMVAASFDNLTNEGSSNPGSSSDVTPITLELWPDGNGQSHTTTGMLNTVGNVSFVFPATIIGNSYWLVVKTPNSLKTFSANPVLISGTTFYSFSNALSQAATDGSAPALKFLAANLYGMYSGDINQDEYIDGTDYALFEADVFNSGNGAFSLPSDLNGDTYVDGSDYPLLDQNSSTGLYVQYPSFL